MPPRLEAPALARCVMCANAETSSLPLPLCSVSPSCCRHTHSFLCSRSPLSTLAVSLRLFFFLFFLFFLLVLFHPPCSHCLASCCTFALHYHFLSSVALMFPTRLQWCSNDLFFFFFFSLSLSPPQIYNIKISGEKNVIAVEFSCRIVSQRNCSWIVLAGFLWTKTHLTPTNICLSSSVGKGTTLQQSQL